MYIGAQQFEKRANALFAFHFVYTPAFQGGLIQAPPRERRDGVAEVGGLEKKLGYNRDARNRGTRCVRISFSPTTCIYRAEHFQHFIIRSA